MRGHIARRTRIGVVVPHAADACGSLEDRDVVVAGAVQHHGSADAAEAAANNGYRPCCHKAEATGFLCCAISGLSTSRSWSWDKPKLLQQPEVVQAPPTFHDLAVGDAENVDAAQRDILARRRLAHHRTTVGAVGNEVLDNKIILSDHVLCVASPIRKGATK
jgi:hypothetical protein